MSFERMLHQQYKLEYLRNLLVAVVLSLLAVWFFLPDQVNAQIAGNDVSLYMRLTEDNRIVVSYDMELVNATSNNFLKQVELDLPGGITQKVQVLANNRKISHTLKDNSNTTRLVVDLTNAKIGPQDKLKLNISYTTAVNPYLFVMNARVLDLAITKFPFDVKTFQFEMDLPNDFGPPVLMKPQPTNQSGDRISYNYIPASILMAWANQMEGTLSYDFTANVQKSGEYLVNIPPNNSYQKITWNKFEKADRGYRDELGNLFASYDVLANEPAVVSITGNVALDFHAEAETDTSGFGYAFNLPQINLNSLNSGRDYLYEGFKLLLTKLTPVSAKSQNIGEIRQTMSQINISNDVEATPLEYCVALGQIASQRNISSRLVYGKLLFPRSEQISENLPYIWCEFLIDGKIITVDPYLTDVIGYEMYDVQQLGKLLLGRFTLDMEPQALFGILTERSQILPTLKAGKLLIPDTQPTQVFSIQERVYDQQVLAGTPINYSVTIKNDTNDIYELGEVRIDNVPANLDIYKNYHLLLLPQLTNNVHFQFAEPNLFYDGMRSFTIELAIADQIITDQVKVQINPNQQAFTSSLTLIALFTAVVIWLVWVGYKFNSKRKRKYYTGEQV